MQGRRADDDDDDDDDDSDNDDESPEMKTKETQKHKRRVFSVFFPPEGNFDIDAGVGAGKEIPGIQKLSALKKMTKYIFPNIYFILCYISYIFIDFVYLFIFPQTSVARRGSYFACIDSPLFSRIVRRQGT